MASSDAAPTPKQQDEADFQILARYALKRGQEEGGLFCGKSRQRKAFGRRAVLPEFALSLFQIAVNFKTSEDNLVINPVFG